MSEERAGQESSERDDLDELLEPDEPEELDSDLEPEPDEPEPESEPEQEPPQQTHDQRRRARQRDELRELRETNRRLLEAVTRQPAQPYQQQPDPVRQAQLDQAERERFLMMDPWEQQQYSSRKVQEQFNRELMLTRLQGADLLDKQAFDNLKRFDPVAKRYAADVESTLSSERAQGRNPSREEILDRLFGRESRDKLGRQTEQARKRGQRRIASQTTRPSGTRSTAANVGSRRNQDQAAEDEALLKGATLGDAWNSM